MDRNGLIRVAKSTENYMDELYENFPETVIYCMENTMFFDSYQSVMNINRQNNNYTKLENKKDGEITVVAQDTIECAHSLIRSGLNPLVLNMASDACPGGGWRYGSSAQEEDLFRRSTYVLSLEQDKIMKHYRLSKMAGIYSPKVIIFRGTRSENYKLYDWKDCYEMNFIAVPALRNPGLIRDKDNTYMLSLSDSEVVCNKIRLMCEVAILYGHDSLVLGAHGCGAYNNPPSYIASLFKKVLGEYGKYFKRITFAILKDKNDKYGNYVNFSKVFS